MELEYEISLTHILLAYLFKKFRNIKEMSDKTDIPYMTISTVLKKGVENSLVRTVVKICDALDITIETLYKMRTRYTLAKIFFRYHKERYPTEYSPLYIQALKDYGAIAPNFEELLEAQKSDPLIPVVEISIVTANILIDYDMLMDLFDNIRA